MRTYLAGRMRGLPQNGKEIFAHYAAFLRSQGHFVVSPAELDESAGIDLAKEATLDEVSDAFARDVPAILSCDAIAMIPGWEQSTLAPIEKKIAEAFGKQVLDAETGHGFVPTSNCVYGTDLSFGADQSAAVTSDFLCLGKRPFDEALDRYVDSMADSIKKGNTYVGVNRDHIEWPTVPVSEEDAPLKEEYTVKDSGKREVMETGSQRDLREGKGRYDLLNPLVLKRDADLYEKGAKKYNARNWELGQRMSRYLDSAMRHLCNHMEGDRAEDHLAAVRWNAAGVMYTEEMIKRGLLPKELDDRPDFITGAHLASIKSENDATHKPA